MVARRPLAARIKKRCSRNGLWLANTFYLPKHYTFFAHIFVVDDLYRLVAATVKRKNYNLEVFLLCADGPLHSLREFITLPAHYVADICCADLLT